MHSAGKRVKHYKFLGPARKLLTRIGIKQKSVKMPFFVRGMDLHEELLFIGISPASVLCVNWITGELVDTFQYSQDVRKAVHGVKVKMN